MKYKVFIRLIVSLLIISLISSCTNNLVNNVSPLKDKTFGIKTLGTVDLPISYNNTNFDNVYVAGTLSKPQSWSFGSEGNPYHSGSLFNLFYSNPTYELDGINLQLVAFDYYNTIVIHIHFPVGEAGLREGTILNSDVATGAYSSNWWSYCSPQPKPWYFTEGDATLTVEGNQVVARLTNWTGPSPSDSCGFPQVGIVMDSLVIKANIPNTPIPTPTPTPTATPTVIPTTLPTPNPIPTPPNTCTQNNQSGFKTKALSPWEIAYEILLHYVLSLTPEDYDNLLQAYLNSIGDCSAKAQQDLNQAIQKAELAIKKSEKQKRREPYIIQPNDEDWRGTGKTINEAVPHAFNNTGVPFSEFVVTQESLGPDGQLHPVEWRVPNGPNRNAEVNIDEAHDTFGPDVPHVGWKQPGKRKSGAKSGHILLDSVPYGRTKSKD